MQAQEKEMIDVQEKTNSIEELLEKEITLFPLVDIYENENEFVLSANIPGLEKEDVKLSIEESSLTIFGKVNFEKIKERKYVLKENKTGNYYRKFNLSDSVDVSKINAVYEKGLLNIHLPKHEKAKPRIIDIR